MQIAEAVLRRRPGSGLIAPRAPYGAAARAGAGMTEVIDA